MRLIIITGMSGSGKSTAARALEDDGFFVIDNLPPVMLPTFLEVTQEQRTDAQDIAVVMDVRSRSFLHGCERVLASMAQQGHEVEILFFDATDEMLVRRYSETRRRHPMSLNGGVQEGILRERMLLDPLRKLSTTLIDTTQLSPHQLRDKVINAVCGHEGSTPLAVCLQSFGFRYGIPPGSDLVIDVRFLPNPHFVKDLRPFTGKDAAVQEFVLNQPVCQEFLERFKGLLEFLLPQYRSEGKSYLTLSIGCTGGRHRSVTLVEALRSVFDIEGISLEVVHRDIAKG